MVYLREPILPNFFVLINHCGMMPPPTCTLWLGGTSVYSILPSHSMGRCTLVYVYQPAEKYTFTSVLTHLQNSASTQKMACIPGFTCVQNVVVKNSWCINPIVWCHAGSRSSQKPVESVQKLANDTVLALGNIKDTLASHKMMILQNRVALDYILATQGGACTIIGPECCTGLMDPTENLNKIHKTFLVFQKNYTDD